MFTRVTAQSLRQGFSTVRNHLYHSYGVAKRFAHNLDYGVEMLARTYKAVQPVLRDAAPERESRVTEKLSSMKSDYNQMRARVQDVDDKATSVVHTLRKKVPELNL